MKNLKQKLKIGAAAFLLTATFGTAVFAQTNEEKLAAANKTFGEATVLFDEGTAESYRAARENFRAAVKLFAAAEDKESEAGALLALGLVSEKLEDKSAALESYNQALPILRFLANKNSEGVALSRIGGIYDDSGEKQKALDYYNQALPLFRIDGDKFQEAVTLNAVGKVYSDLGDQRKALDYFNQALPLLRAVKDKSGEATALLNIGKMYSDLDEKQKALQYYNQALPLLKEVGDKLGEEIILINFGDVYSALGEKRKALDYYNQAMALTKTVDNKNLESTILNDIGEIYSNLGEKQKALDYYNQSLSFSNAVGDKNREAATLINIGSVYNSLGEKQKALDYYNQTLSISKANGDKKMEATILNNIGLVYADLGESQKALDFHNQGLSLSRTIGDKSLEETILSNIGVIYAHLGEKRKALDFYNQALLLERVVGDKTSEETTINNIGQIFADLGENQKALDYFNQALPLSRAVGDRNAEAIILDNIGGVYFALNENQKALDYSNQSLALCKAVGDKNGEATALNNIGNAYEKLGEIQKALDYANRALPLLRAVGDKRTEATTLENMMVGWNKSGNKKFAAFYGKQSVNDYQQLRSNIKGLDKSIQRTYLKLIEQAYRYLADILIADGRIAEAEEVLAMLKEEEFFAYLRRSDKVAADLKGKISLSPDEKKAFADYEIYADGITQTAAEFGELEKKKSNLPLGESLAAADQKQYDALKGKYDAAIVVFDKFLNDLKVRFGVNDKRVAVVESDTQGILKRLDEPRTVVISTIVGEDRLNLIVTTSDTQRAHVVDIKAADLNKLVTEFRDAVKNPQVDPRLLGKQLYDKLFPAALQKDLDNIKADTIVWSLDGSLRYVPMAALWDGQRYLVERYTNAVLTLASRDKISAITGDRTKWLALGVGVSKAASVKKEDGSTATFEALAAVPQELCSVVTDTKKKDFCGAFGKQKTGVLSGLMLADEDFTLQNFENNVGKVPVVHIASHFSLNAGDESDSYLLLGGGTERRFSLMSLRKTRLDKVELLTLSACNTAMTAGENSSGVEIEGFGALAQQQGAKTVLASLWSVADASTRDLMTAFYSNLETDTKIGKAEALRQAQIQLLDGTYKNTESAQKRRSEVIVFGDNNTPPNFKTDPNAPFAHPFYWSPFILFGNWR